MVVCKTGQQSVERLTLKLNCISILQIIFNKIQAKQGGCGYGGATGCPQVVQFSS